MKIREKLSKSNFINQLKTLLGYKKYRPVNSFPLGHFYSPIVSKNEIKEFENQIWEESNNVNGVELNEEQQLRLLEKFNQYYKELPFKDYKEKNLRYTFKNNSYEYTDAIILYSFLRHFKPKNIIEIGSGYSSAVMIDTIENFNLDANITFIEPNPKVLHSLINKEDKRKYTFLKNKVQEVKIEEFKKLKEADVLFIDSSHISKTGSDVNFEIFNILPNLNSGVIIHFHDIFYPFEYPKEWVLEGRNWNENYILRAFLSYNNQFEILFFSQFLHKYHKEAFANMPLTYNNKGGNLWIRKK